MSASLVDTIVAELSTHPEALAELASALAPYAPGASGDRWMDTREAASYLGFRSPSPLKKLVAARQVPYVQDTPGGKCWFQRSALDRWRLGGT